MRCHRNFYRLAYGKIGFVLCCITRTCWHWELTVYMITHSFTLTNGQNLMIYLRRFEKSKMITQFVFSYFQSDTNFDNLDARPLPDMCFISLFSVRGLSFILLTELFEEFLIFTKSTLSTFSLVHYTVDVMSKKSA